MTEANVPMHQAFNKSQYMTDTYQKHDNMDGFYYPIVEMIVILRQKQSK